MGGGYVMNTRLVVITLLVGLVIPAITFANQGILLLAHNGTPDWNAQVNDLAAKVNARKPVEVAFGTPTRSIVAPAVDRLAKRGATEVVAVPFFLSAAVSPEDLTGHAIPVRIAPAAAHDPLFSEIILSRAEEISQQPTGEVLVVIGYGSDDAGRPWVIDLAPSALRLNQTRRFASILTVAKPADRTEAEQQQIRLSLEWQVAAGRPILVVPVMKSPSGTDPAIEQTLQGFTYRTAKGGVISDDRVAEWLANQTATSVR
jgi:sirohydrochlorin ferrochelatase